MVQYIDVLAWFRARDRKLFSVLGIWTSFAKSETLLSVTRLRFWWCVLYNKCDSHNSLSYLPCVNNYLSNCISYATNRSQKTLSCHAIYHNAQAFQLCSCMCRLNSKLCSIYSNIKLKSDVWHARPSCTDRILQNKYDILVEKSVISGLRKKKKETTLCLFFPRLTVNRKSSNC